MKEGALEDKPNRIDHCYPKPTTCQASSSKKMQKACSWLHILPASARLQWPSRVQEVDNPSHSRLSSSVYGPYGFLSGIQSDTCHSVQVHPGTFAPPTRPSEDSTILKTSWSPATSAKPGKFQSVDGRLFCYRVLKMIAERAVTHDGYRRIEVSAA